MKSGTIIVAVVLAYIGFEAYAIKKASHRTRPAFIHALLVKAGTAAKFCDLEDPALGDRFKRTLSRATNRYRSELSDENPNLSAQAIDSMIIEKEQLAKAEVEAEISSTDCSARVMQDHLRRYGIYARKSR